MGSNRVTIGSELPAGTKNIGSVTIGEGIQEIGTVTANAGTNLNTSALATEATLATVRIDTGSIAVFGATATRQDTQTTALGAVTETAPASDTASSGLNGRLQRIAQNITSLIAKFTTGAGTEAAALRVTLPTDGTGKIATVTTVTAVTALTNALPAGTNNIGDVDVLTLPAITGAVTANAGTNLNTSALSLDATTAAGNVLIGSVTEAAPSSDTASSGLNGRLQRLAQLSTASNSLTGVLNETAPATDTAQAALNGRLQRIAQRLTSLIALLPTALGAGGGLKVDGSGTALPVSGTVTVGTLPALVAGTANIGDVDVLTLPALVAGTANIGDVDVLTLPALPAGTNNIGDVDVLSVIPGTGATNLGKAEDGAHTTGDVGVFNLGVRQAALAPTSGADLDYEAIQTDEVGQVKVTAGRILRSTTTITRPSDTTAYAASDEISSSTSAPAVITFTSCARISGWGGTLQSVILIDSAGNTSPPNLELWLFDSSVTPDNDNAAFAPTDAECAKLVAVVPLGTGYAGDPTVGTNGNRVFTASGLGMSFQCSGSTSLFGRLVVRNAYTPISAETFQIILYVIPD